MTIKMKKKLTKKMTSKDFRIGNYHLYDGKLDRIDSRYALAFENEFMDGIEPINLTEQWLIDFGFEKEVLSDNSAYYYKFKFKNEKYCDLSIISEDKDENGFLEVALSPYEDFFRYKYVHELQNLVFAITGKELELKTDM